MSIEWHESLATGVETIDNQHREIFSRFEGFAAAINGGEGADEVSRLMDFLSAYVVEHFEAEEALQEECGYPGLDDHRRRHRAFLEELAHLKEKVQEGGSQWQLIIELRRSMIRWLILHIRQKDRDFADYLRASARH